MTNEQCTVDCSGKGRNYGPAIHMWTGPWGMYHFNWAVAKEAGLIPPTVERRDAKLVGIVRHRVAIDERGEMWAWEPAYGKIHWTRMGAARFEGPRPDPRYSRFNFWEAARTIIQTENGWITGDTSLKLKQMSEQLNEYAGRLLWQDRFWKK